MNQSNTHDILWWLFIAFCNPISIMLYVFIYRVSFRDLGECPKSDGWQKFHDFEEVDSKWSHITISGYRIPFKYSIKSKCRHCGKIKEE